MTIFFNFLPTSNHLHPLQVENREEDDNGKLRLKRVKWVFFPESRERLGD